MPVFARSVCQKGHAQVILVAGVAYLAACGSGEEHGFQNPEGGAWAPSADGDSGTTTEEDRRNAAAGALRKPEFRSQPPLRTFEGATYRYQPSYVSPASAGARFELVQGPPGLRVHEDTGVLAWRVPFRSSGTHPIRVKAVDRAGQALEQNWDLVVERRNAPPRITSKPPQPAAIGANWVYPATVEDPNGDAVSWQLENAPAGMTVDATGKVFWTSAAVGAQTVVLKARDAEGGMAEQTFTATAIDPARRERTRRSCRSPWHGA